MMKVKAVLAVLTALLTGCAMMPDHVQPVERVDAERYMGTWYEIARLDHSFERSMEKVTATYTLKSDGGISVLNKGFLTTKQQWKEAQGTAYFREETPNGKIKVSFFWPFYGGYNIVDLDADYTSVLIIGPSLKYAWILSRTPALDAKRYEYLLEKAEAIGVSRDSWISVKQ